jgi:hypothetical protein
MGVGRAGDGRIGADLNVVDLGPVEKSGATESLVPESPSGERATGRVFSQDDQR